MAFLKEQNSNLKELDVSNIKEHKAKGLEANFEGRKILGGNLELLRANGIEFNLASDKSIYIFAIEGKVVALFELQDIIKPNAKEFVEQIKKLGIKVVMLTGDQEEVAKAIAKEVGIDEVKANLLPTDKAEIIEQYHKNGEIIVMVGDGINDSIALAKSDIAIAMGSGADVALEVSDVVLLNNSLSTLKNAFLMAKNVFKSIKQNLALSLLYNVIAIPLAVMGYVTPLIAALAMSLSSLTVVANSFRIKGTSKKGELDER
jgi:Cu+-exporting ATPase